MPNNARPTNVFETRAIQDYFESSHLAKIRYACVRAVELDDHLGGAKNSGYFNAALELSNAIRLSLGLDAVVVTVEGATVEVAVAETAAPKSKEVKIVEETTEEFDRSEVIYDLGFPETEEELSDRLSKKKIVTVLESEDNSDLVEDLGITSAVLDYKKADLIKFIYTGAK